MISRGVTAREFQALMRERSESARPDLEDTIAFLDRCCALGLLRRVTDTGLTRYFATPALAAAIGWIDL